VVGGSSSSSSKNDKRVLLAGACEAHQYDPPVSRNVCCNFSVSGGSHNLAAGKGLGVANAEAVESSKTLLQGRAGGGAGTPPAHPPTRDGGGSLDGGAPGRLVPRSPAQTEIRIADERSTRRGELLLGRYLLQERLGAGGFGTVWRAHDEQLDRAVAVKRIPLPSEEDRERATREAHATARLAHPAIVALYEASSDEDAFYLISELIEGATLAELISADELADEEVLEIGVALLNALEHAHARGVIHRDVKPQNVLVPSDAAEHTPTRGATPWPAKLADFGGARLAGDDALTRTGDVLGTLAYMAPEQSEGHEAGPEADLYSLALLLYEALSGVNPVRGRTPAATARRIGAPVEPLERRRRDLPRELTRALDRGLLAEPERRGTLGDLHHVLERTLEQGLRPRLFARRGPRRQTASTAPSEDAQDRSVFRAHANSDRTWPAAPGVSPANAAVAPSVDPRRGARGSDLRDLDDELDEQKDRARRSHTVAMPRRLWLGCLLALAAWQAFAGLPGVSLLVLAAGAPLLALPRRAGPGWLAAGLAPALGLAGLAGAFPALAGQRASWLARAGLAVLGFWWLALAESLVRRSLWLGPPVRLPPRAAWESSIDAAATHVIAPTFTVELLLGAAVWALASAILPWLVRGRSAALDVGAAVLWTIALLAAVPLLERALFAHASQPSPHGALLGAVLGCALAICARALRGPV
jgi:eukaryotic-like serine/threonine-protein kinase